MVTKYTNAYVSLCLAQNQANGDNFIFYLCAEKDSAVLNFLSDSYKIIFFSFSIKVYFSQEKPEMKGILQF